MVSDQFWRKILHFVFIQFMWNLSRETRCAAISNLAYFINELTTALKCQKQLLMSSISNLGGRESLEIAVTGALKWAARPRILIYLSFLVFK